MKFYSAMRKNDTMWFEGKWMQLEDIMLSEVSQVQKDKGHAFSLLCGRQIQKINMYTKTSMIICKHKYSMFVIIELHYGIWGGKGKGNDTASTVL
jgi:hypothetical protein